MTPPRLVARMAPLMLLVLTGALLTSAARVEARDGPFSPTAGSVVTDGPKRLVLQACSDQEDFCPDWAGKGYCASGYIWNGQSVADVVCPASCGTCGQGNEAPAGTSGAGGTCSDASGTLSQINAYRAAHGAPAASWDSGLAADAAAWAGQLAAAGCGLQHGGANGAGQNLYGSWGGSGDPVCADAIDSWYSEVSNYRFTATPIEDNDFKSTGHFTQLVWVGSTSVGCGVGVGSGGCRVVACHFRPPGNIQDDAAYVANVLPSTK